MHTGGVGEALKEPLESNVIPTEKSQKQGERESRSIALFLLIAVGWQAPAFALAELELHAVLEANDVAALDCLIADEHVRAEHVSEVMGKIIPGAPAAAGSHLAPFRAGKGQDHQTQQHGRGR